MTLEIKFLQSEDIDEKLLRGLSVLLGNDAVVSNKRLHTAEYFKWKLDNPFGPSYIVAAYDEGILIGCMTLTRKPADPEWGFVQYELGDVMVSVAARGKKLFEKMLRLAVDELKKFDAVAVYGTPNEAALPHEKRVGFEVLDNGLSYVGFPLNVSTYFGSLFRFLLFPFGLLAALISKGIQLLMRAVLNVEIVDGFTGTPSGCEYGSGGVLKSVNYLQWRYLDTPERYLNFSVQRNGEMFSAFVLKEIRYKKFSMLFLVDWILFKRKSYLSLAVLLKVFELNVANFLAIVAMTSDGSRKVLPLLNFWYRFKSLKFIVLSIGAKMPVEGVDKNIYMSFRGGDGDNI